MAIAVARVMLEYKESKDFEDNATAVRANAYIFGFTDCQEVIVQAYPKLDLIHILEPREEEGGAGEQREEEAYEAILKEPTTAPEA